MVLEREDDASQAVSASSGAEGSDAQGPQPRAPDHSTSSRIAVAAAGAAALICGGLALLHLRMIVSAAPQEMREGAVVWITRLLIEGRNPYALEELPASTNVYGILYHLIVLPLAVVFGNGYTVHRAVSGAAIAAASVVFYRLLRREHTDLLLAVVGTLLFYVSSLYFVAPLARPDGLGVLLTMIGIAVLFRNDLTWRQFGIGVAVSVLALLTKVYFAFPLFIAAAYVFLFVSPRRGLAYGTVAVTVCVAVLLGITAIYPGYITTSIVTNINTETFYDAAHMRQQSVDWVLYSLPAVVATALVAARLPLTKAPRQMIARRPTIFAFAAVVNTMVFVGWLGGHPGSHMTYLFHLLTPVLLPAVLPRMPSNGWPRACVTLALPISLVLSLKYFPLTFQRFSDAEATFARVDAAIAAHRNVLGSTEIAGPLALSGRPVADTGQSQYFRDAALDWRLPGLLPASAIHERWRRYEQELNEGIAHRRYDLVVRSRRTGPIPADLGAQNYVRTQTVDIDFPWGSQRWPLDFWEPRH